MLLLLLGSLAFVGLAIFLIPTEPLIGYITIIFFGLCAIVGAISLLPQSSYLELSQEGFLMCSLFRKSFVKWSDVQEFFPIKIQLNSMVGLRFSQSFNGTTTGRKIATALSGVEGALPDTYGMTAVALAILMNELRNKYAEGNLSYEGRKS